MTSCICQNSENYTKQRVSPKANYGVLLIITNQYWFVNYNKGTTLMQDVNIGNKGNGRVGMEWVYETLYSPLNCSINLKLLKF